MLFPLVMARHIACTAHFTRRVRQVRPRHVMRHTTATEFGVHSNELQAVVRFHTCPQMTLFSTEIGVVADVEGRSGRLPETDAAHNAVQPYEDT